MDMGQHWVPIVHAGCLTIPTYPQIKGKTASTCPWYTFATFRSVQALQQLKGDLQKAIAEASRLFALWISWEFKINAKACPSENKSGLRPKHVLDRWPQAWISTLRSSFACKLSLDAAREVCSLMFSGSDHSSTDAGRGKDGGERSERACEALPCVVPDPAPSLLKVLIAWLLNHLNLGSICFRQILERWWISVAKGEAQWKREGGAALHNQWYPDRVATLAVLSFKHPSRFYSKSQSHSIASFSINSALWGQRLDQTLLPWKSAYAGIQKGHDSGRLSCLPTCWRVTVTVGFRWGYVQIKIRRTKAARWSSKVQEIYVADRPLWGNSSTTVENELYNVINIANITTNTKVYV